MKIAVIGGGPGGLYFALLTKKQMPDCEIEVFEQNRADDTFGFGVVFSDDTLDEFLSADPESYEAIRSKFAYWTDIAIEHKGGPVVLVLTRQNRSTAQAISGPIIPTTADRYP